jgi:Uma2 family endonuclease
MAVLNLVKLPITTIDLSPGSHLLINDVTWEQYEALLTDWGEDRRIPRLNYCHGVLELTSPLPAHERPHRIIANIVKAMLDAQDRPWEDFGSTTFKQPRRAGLEPDTCFYIQHAEQVRPLMRMDMEPDPPPDLAIESDVTSKTTFEAYATLQDGGSRANTGIFINALSKPSLCLTSLRCHRPYSFAGPQTLRQSIFYHHHRFVVEQHRKGDSGPQAFPHADKLHHPPHGLDQPLRNG